MPSSNTARRQRPQPQPKRVKHFDLAHPEQWDPTHPDYKPQFTEEELDEVGRIFGDFESGR